MKYAGETAMRNLNALTLRLHRHFDLELGSGARSIGLNFSMIRKFRFARFAPALAVLIGVSPMAFGLKEVVSVRLDPSTIAPGDAFVIYVTAQYDSSNSGGRSDDDYATTQYTLDGTSSCINNADATLGSTPVEYGPYSVTSPADISDGSYSVSVDIFSKNNCANSGQSSASSGAATATLTVSGTNATPVAVDDASPVAEDGSVVIAVLANDSDSDGALDATSVTITIDPANGSVSVNAVTGEVTYSGDANFVGRDTFDYTVEDNAGAVSSAATVTVTVAGVNDPPALTGDHAGPVAKGGSYTFTISDLFYQDIDDGDAEVTFSASSFINGGLLLSGVSVTSFTGAELSAGDVAFEHDDSGSSTGSFVVTVEDGNEDGSAPTPATVTLTVVSADAAYSEVTDLFDLSDEPLELVTPSSPNVVVLQDTSSSLNSDIMTEELNGYYPDASAPTRPWNNIYGSGPSPAKQADKESDTSGSGFWRLRNKDYNRIYYNPELRYSAWAECSGAGAPSGCLSTASPDASLYYYYVWKDTTDAACPTNNEGVVDPTPSPLDNPIDTCSEGRLVSIKSETGAAGAAAAIADLTAFSAENFDDGNDRYPRFPLREDCVDASFCTLAEEQANFLNYYTWYRTRGTSMKASLGSVISEADTNLRIGFAGSNGVNDNVALDDLGASGHKTALLGGLYSRSFQGNSNFFSSFAKAGEYLECEGQNIFYGPSSTPGDAQCPALAPPQGTCQQNYILLITDGGMEGYNSNLGNQSPGDADANDDTDFDGKIFAGTKPSQLGDTTLADIAMHYYERDLFPSVDMVNDVVPLQRDLDLAPSGSFSGDVMHQHVKTFAVAFGIDSGLVNPPTSYSTGSYDWGSAASTDQELADFLIKDLHHAATNGRGAYLDAQNPAALTAALEAAFNEFSAGLGAGSAVSFNSQEISNGVVLFRSFYNLLENTGDVIASTLNADLTVGAQLWSTAAQLDVQLDTGGTGRQIVTFDPGNNRGQAFQLGSLTTAQKQSLGWVDASSDAEVALKIDYLRGSSVNEAPAGDYRSRPELNGRLGDIINSSPVFVGPPEQLFRGGSAYPSGSNSYAAFQNAQASRADRLYVSANDGMLHSIDPEAGNEKFAFVPNATLVNGDNVRLAELLSTGYSHQYILDATPVVDDLFMFAKGDSTKSWVTVLVGAFGAGGKGLFALDITDPAITEANANQQILWEFTNGDDTYPLDDTGSPLLSSGAQRLDGAGNPIKDLGLTIDEPILALSNVVTSSSDESLEWMALLSNGTNGTSGVAKLFALFVDRGTDGTWCHPESIYDNSTDGSSGLRGTCDAGQYDFIKIDTGEGAFLDGGSIYPNGLGSPRAIDADQDGTADYVYAGDMQGNLFRFDLCRADLASYDDYDTGAAVKPANMNSVLAYTGGDGGCKKGVDVYKNWVSAKIFEASYTSTGGTTTSQPILNKPVLVASPTGAGYIVIVGTGRYIVNGDRSDTDIQSIYGIWDRLGSDVVTKSKLIQQSYTNICESDASSCGRRLSDCPVNLGAAFDASEESSSTCPQSQDVDVVLGWFNDLNVAQDSTGTIPASPGERAVRNFQIRGELGFVNSVIPTVSNACSASAGGFGLAFCPKTGGDDCIDSGVFDINNDGAFDSSDRIDNFTVAGTIFEDSAPTDSAFVGENRVTQLTDRSLSIVKTNTASTVNTGRLSWRRLSND